MGRKEIIGMYGGSFNPLHNGHIKCIKKALTMCDKLYIVAGYLPNRDIIPLKEKQRLLETIFVKNEDKINFIWLKDETEDKKNYNINSWKNDAEKIKNIIGKK